MEELIWTLDYEATGEKVAKLKDAMTDFLPKLRADPKILRVNVLMTREANPLRMRVEIVSSGDPFNPPWPSAFMDTQKGDPLVFLSQPKLSIARR